MNFLKKFALSQVIKNVLSKLSADHKTTIVGVLGAALLSANIDFAKLFEGDSDNVTKAVSSVVLSLIGFYTNRGGSNAVPEEVHEVREEKDSSS